MRVAIVLACVLAAARVCVAQPDVEALRREVEALAARSADASLPGEARRVAARTAIERRADLIGAAGDDVRVGSWMVDQGAALLATLASDGADTAVLFDADVLDQRERTRAVVDEVLGLLGRARRALDAGAERLEAEGDEEEAARLRQVERDVRLAFFEARALLLASALSGEEAPARRAIAALSALELEGAAESARRANLGNACLRVGEDERAKRLLGLALELALAGEAPRTVWCEAAVGMAICEARAGDVAGAVRRLDGALLDKPVVQDRAADGALAATVLVARADVLIDAGRAPEAFGRHLALLDRGLPGLEPDVSRWLVLACMSRSTRGMGDLSGVPAEVSFARAIEAARDPSRRSEAVELLSSVADRRAGEALGADALWELGVLLLSSGDAADSVEAVRALTRLAAEDGGAARAPEALGAALAYGRAGVEAGTPGAAGAYDDALATLASGDVAVEDRTAWLLERARRELIAGRLSSGLAALERIPAEDARTGEAVELYRAAMHEALATGWSELRTARLRGREEAVRSIARDRLVPLASRGVAYARDRGLAWVEEVRADRADAMTEAGMPGGRLAYQALLEEGASVSGGEARLRLGLGRSLLLAGEWERGFDQLRTASELLGGTVPQDAEGRERFWQCWTLMLEVLGRANEDGSRSGTIVAHAVRLASIDPALGGPPWRERIEAARAAAR